MKPYSLRRGGATFLLQEGTPIDVILLRGRWRSLGVARLYLEDGLAQVPQLRVPDNDKLRLQKYAEQCPATAFRPWLEAWKGGSFSNSCWSMSISFFNFFCEIHVKAVLKRPHATWGPKAVFSCWFSHAIWEIAAVHNNRPCHLVFENLKMSMKCWLSQFGFETHRV